MAQLSISKAWTETGAFLARESRLVLPIALLLVAIPPAASGLFGSPPGVQPTLAQATIDLLLAIVTVVASLIAGVAISHLALRSGASVGEALQRGSKRFLSLLGVALLITIPLLLIAFLLIAAIGPSSAVMQQPIDPYNLPPELASVLIILAIIVLAFWVKISMTTPIAAAERGGPITILRRSWRLTSGHYWKLLGTFLLLMIVASLVIMGISLGIGLIVLLVSGPPLPGGASFTIMVLIDALLQAIVATVLVVLIARIYAQLAGEDTAAP